MLMISTRFAPSGISSKVYCYYKHLAGHLLPDNIIATPRASSTSAPTHYTQPYPNGFFQRAP